MSMLSFGTRTTRIACQLAYDARGSADRISALERSELDALAVKINAAHRRCEHAAMSALEGAYRAGELLNRAKARVRHGEWLGWLEANFEVSEPQAHTYMRGASRIGGDWRFDARWRLAEDRGGEGRERGRREVRGEPAAEGQQSRVSRILRLYPGVTLPAPASQRTRAWRHVPDEEIVRVLRDRGHEEEAASREARLAPVGWATSDDEERSS
jgi:hypothetical protein